MSHIHCLSCILANSYNVMQPAAMVHIHVTAKLADCAIPEWYDNCQLLQPVHRFVRSVNRSPSKGCGKPTVRTSSHFFQQLSNPKAPCLSNNGPLVRSFTCMLLTPRATLSLIVLFCVLFVCKCVLYYCHQVLSKLQLTNISIIIRGYYGSHYMSLCRWLGVLMILKNVICWWKQNYYNKHGQNLLVFYTNKTQKYTTVWAQPLHSLSSPHTVNSSIPSQPLYPRSCPHTFNSKKQ